MRRPAGPMVSSSPNRRRLLLPRRGTVLLESLVGLAIATIVALAVLTSLREATHALALLEARRAAIREAGDFLAAVSLWPRDDLERRLGTRPQGPWLLTIAMPAPTLFEVELAEARTRHVLLVTTLYRPEEPACRLADAVASPCSK